MVVGGGFAGVACAKLLAGEDRVRVTLVDKNGYQQFQPLLYQVATAEPSRPDMAFDLHHTFASLLIQHGESLAYIKAQLGHSSIQVTVDTYGHLIPGANRAAVERLDDVTSRNPTATTNGKGTTA